MPLYLRPSAILVRPGNPDKITGLTDLFKPGHKVLVVNGAGQNGLPYIVPTSLTIWDAAAPPESLTFLLVGALVLVPIILDYTAYAYWVFRGKVRHEEGYH